ncbi:hypothetical protein NDS46_30725 (plasmid) [Paenibacillus thiaminolyticus]|uniref:hypothetical protein n=1 Tax=Paenibacillus thiaminolyticus TaxID=49283 RepID=UPI00232F903F|nr:hypothetical protein [Paenibacillus thiaminolyticus]WCF11721.1 hypothetical protein NDS46_30725 [Paenibacillus thiaminolyticus]
MSSKTIKRSFAIFMVLLFVFNPIKSFAHQAYFFQVLMDTEKMSYQTAILSDDSSRWLGLESGHIEAEFGNFRDPLINNGDEFLVVPSDSEAYSDTGGFGKEIMPFTFPAMEQGDGWFDGKTKNHATQNDVNRAYIIKDTLTTGLNDALFILNEGKRYQTKEEFAMMSVALSKAINQSYTGNGTRVRVEGTPFTLQVGTRASYSINAPLDLKNGIHSSDYLVISNGEQEYEYVYRMEKGYYAKSLVNGFDWNNKVYNSDYEFKNDVKYITWNSMMYQAFYAIFAKNMTAKESGTVAHVGPFEEAIKSMLESLFNGLRNLLGLYGMNELIYNDGIRGSNAWFFGIMPRAWEENVMIYHWIFQALAWALITFSIVKLLMARNMATINPSARVSLIEGIKDLLITGVVLAFIMPLINLFIMINSMIVDVFAAVGPDLDEMTGLNEYTGLLAGVLLQFFYLIILMWLNFTYIIRSISVAILTVMSPIFIITLSLGAKWKALFVNWTKELLSNIFLQSFHAFLIGFLYVSQISSRGIEMAVICFAMIPLTELFRGMIMGQAGGMANRLGVGSLVMAGAFATDAMRRGKNTVGMSRMQNGSTGSESVMSGSSGFGEGSVSNKTFAAGGDLKTGSSDRIKRNQAMEQSRTKHQDTRNVQLEKQIPPEIAMQGKDSEEYQRFVGGQVKSERQAKIDDFKDNLKENYFNRDFVAKAGVGGLKAVAGGTGMLAGAGYALALGAENAGAVIVGARVARKSGGMAAKSVGPGVSKAYGDLKTGVQLSRDFKSTRSSNAATPASDGKGLNKALPSARAASHEQVGAQSITPRNSSVDPNRSNLIPNESSSGSKSEKSVGADMSGAMYAQSVGKGNSEVYRDGKVLSEQGILRAHEDENGNAVYAYDVEKLGAHDRRNLANYTKVFTSGSKEAKDHLRQSGIEGVYATADNKLVVSYNQTGKEAMGIKNVRMSGGNVIETKRADQPMSTKVSVDIPPITPKVHSTQKQKQRGGSSYRNSRHSNGANDGGNFEYKNRNQNFNNNQNRS